MLSSLRNPLLNLKGLKKQVGKTSEDKALQNFCTGSHYSNKPTEK